MSQLLDAMMPTKYRWQSQAARLLSYHIAFTVVYLPGWVIGSIIIARGVFANTNVAIVLIYFILSGIALASLSILGASFFNRSQLSGVVTTIAYILLAILAQTLTSPSTATVTALSLLFVCFSDNLPSPQKDNHQSQLLWKSQSARVCHPSCVLYPLPGTFFLGKIAVNHLVL